MEHAPKIVFQMGNIAIKHPIFLTPTVQTNLCTIVARNTGTYLSNLNKLCSLQNKCICCICFADIRESSQVFYKLLDIPKFDTSFDL